MWTMTPIGFFSAVQHRDDRRLLVVRTRDHADAEELAAWYADDREDADYPGHGPKSEILAYDHSDYPWRVILPQVAYARFIAQQVAAIDYGNFKDAVKEQQGPDRARVYGKVWADLLELEDLDPESTREPATRWERPWTQADQDDMDGDWGPEE